MARTTVDNVEAIIDIDSGISLTPFIEVANALVTEVCSTVTDSVGDLVYDSTRLELIERWLAAHFYHIRDPKPHRDEVDDVQVTYRSIVEIGFNNTHYGQMAMRIDTNGGLSRLDSSIKLGSSTTVSLSWLGKTKTEIQQGE